MERGIITQLKKALDILIDYPGIEEILDVESAKKFLIDLESVPTPPQNTSMDIIECLRIWRLSIQQLGDCIQLDLLGESLYEGNIISGCVPSNQTQLLRWETEDDYCIDSDWTFFCFNGNDFAELKQGDTDEKKEGSWRTIYEALATHIATITTVPV